MKDREHEYATPASIVLVDVAQIGALHPATALGKDVATDATS
jgi:hypothetical protein